MAAEPMFRAPRPEMVSESNLASCAIDAETQSSKPRSGVTTNFMRAKMLRISKSPFSARLGSQLSRTTTSENFCIWMPGSTASRGSLGLGFGSGNGKVRVVQGHVLYDFFDANLCARRTAFGSLLDGKRVIDSVHFFVIAIVDFRLLQGAADGGLNFQFQLQKRIGVKVVVPDIAILHAELNFVAIGAFDRIVSDQLGLVALFLVVHQRAINVRVNDQTFQVVLRHQFRVSAPAKRIDLPARLAVIGLHLGHSLNDEFFANFSWALVFLHDFGAKQTL